MRHPRAFIRNLDADVHLEIFLVAAVAAILGIRLYLKLAGYPQLGGGSLHIAHMLWGGLGMLLALWMLLFYLDRDAVRLAACIGGIGFGTFIDEVGKFLTKDNDYFFQPAVAVIYALFVALVLGSHALLRRLPSSEEYLMNALQELEELARHDLDAGERGRALQLLDRSDPLNPLVQPLRDLLHRAPLAPAGRPGLYSRVRHAVSAGYDRLVARPRFQSLLVAFFVAQITLKLVYVVLLVFFPWTLPSPDGGPPLALGAHLGQLGPASWGQLGSTLLAALFVALGVAALPRSRAFAYRMFKRSVVTTIVLTQVFIFYSEQVSAVVGLALNVLLLVALQAALDIERARGVAEPDEAPLVDAADGGAVPGGTAPRDSPTGTSP